MHKIMRGSISSLKDMVFLIESLIIWVQNHLEKYKSGYLKEETIENIKKLSQFTDEQFDEISKRAKSEKEIGYALKTFSTPFLDSRIEYMPLLDFESQNKISQIRSSIYTINEDIEECRYYFRLTFDSSLSPENQQIIRKNLDDKYRWISREAKKIVEKIDSLSFEHKTHRLYFFFRRKYLNIFKKNK